MKKILPFFPVLLALTIAHVPAEAQHALPTSQQVPSWVPESGFWVVQSSLHEPAKHTIYFYTDQRELVYKEEVEGVQFNVESDRIRMHLKKALETALLAWRKQKLAKENEGLVISLLQRK